MSVNQRTALLFHEGIYALMSIQDNYQSASEAREITAYLFSRDFEGRGRDSWNRLINFPYSKLRNSTSDLSFNYTRNLFQKFQSIFPDEVELGTEFVHSEIHSQLGGMRNFIASLTILKGSDRSQVYQVAYNAIKKSKKLIEDCKSSEMYAKIIIGSIEDVKESHGVDYSQHGKGNKKFMSVALSRDLKFSKLLDDKNGKFDCTEHLEVLANQCADFIYNQMQKVKP